MKNIRNRLKPVSIFLVTLMLTLSLPYQSALAALVGTEDLMGSQKATEARAYISSVLAREDIQTALIIRGIDPIEAQARVGTLTDQEAIQFADTMEQLPAGGLIGYLVGLTVFVFLVLLVTDILGYTDIFPFVKKTVK
ncbi:MAG: PA2779 family protein [Desulfobacterales bacterium]|nr:PA2779 family protein [Desulfobacterales bacterium]MDX2511520.1 PA2779 family protein [Desulfobacterales bacterium]